MLDKIKRAALAVRDLYLRAWAKNWKLTAVLTFAVVALLLALLTGCACNPSNPPEAPSCVDGSCSV